MTDYTMNARELLESAAKWLGWHEELMCDGLKSGEDALKLYDYAQKHPELDEMADTWDPSDRKKALGYDPFEPSR